MKKKEQVLKIIGICAVVILIVLTVYFKRDEILEILKYAAPIIVLNR